MSDLDDRKKAFETKYANDQETLFKIEARAVKLLGLWAAQEMGLNDADATDYAGNLVAHNLKEPGLDDVTTKVAADMAAKGKPADAIAAMLARFLKDAEAQMRAA
jgi:hypothetical protein